MAHILLLEPDKLLARSYVSSLQMAGHDVHHQNDAQKALSVLDEHDIQLIILELELPHHNGVEFLYEMRSYPDWDHIPVVLHTMVPAAHPGLGRIFWKELGITAYYYKPHTSLVQLVRYANQHLSTPVV